MSFYSDVYDDLKLYTTPEKFYIQPKSDNKLLVIDRLTGTLNIQSGSGHISAASSCKQFCGILGSIRLLAGQYLIIATGRKYVGSIAGQNIWCLTNNEIIPYSRGTLHLSIEEQTDNSTYISMVEQVLATPSFYFSYSYDLTHTMQRLHGTGPDFLSQSLIDRADQRFVWNGFVLKNFHQPEFKQFCLPLIHGFVSINQMSVNECNFMWAVISRRSVFRAGTRLFRRGIDNSGNVANFVETEEMVEYNGDRGSFVQIRGSIPLYWTQLPDLRYKPPPQIQDVGQEEQLRACAKHLENIKLIYGRQVVVDLVDQRGSEGRLQSAFAATIQQLRLPSVRYEPFDFHAECRHMRWDRLSILLDRVAMDQDDMGFFLLLRDGSLSSTQDGVFRTNCIDCLDRTNVVQSMLARRSLTKMLRKMSILQMEQSVEDFDLLERNFKEVWADNADLISIQYSGTGALKTDFTRTGKRTQEGMLRDGSNSIHRYFKNNFSDGFRQDSLDVFHGVAEVFSPLRVERSWRYITFPSVLLIASAMFVTCAVVPTEYSKDSLLFLLFWGCMVMTTLVTIFKHGPEFVDRPRLIFM